MKSSSRLVPTIIIGIVMYAGFSMVCTCFVSLLTQRQTSDFLVLLAWGYLPALLTGAAMGVAPGLGWRSLSAFVCSLVYLLQWPAADLIYSMPASLLAAGAAYLTERMAIVESSPNNDDSIYKKIGESELPS